MFSSSVAEPARSMVLVGLLFTAASLVGCEPRSDPYAEHLLEQRNKAIKQLEQKAQRDKSFDLLCWDISPHMDKPNTVKNGPRA